MKNTDIQNENSIEKESPSLKNKKPKKLATLDKVQVITGIIILALVITVYPTYSWFNSKREIARLERISSPNMLFVTAAHREDVIHLVMDDIEVDGQWIDSSDNKESATYQDFVFSIAGEHVQSYTLQLTHTTNNPYLYEIFVADSSGGVPQAGEIAGKDYIRYKLTEENQTGLTDMDNHSDERIITEGEEKVIYYRIKKEGGLPITLNQTADLRTDPDDSSLLETNNYTYQTGKSVTFNGHYLNKSGRTATGTYNNLNYGEYAYKSEYVQPLYWQCTNIPGSDVTTKKPFYHEYIIRVYFNGATTTYKDTDIIYLTVVGNN